MPTPVLRSTIIRSLLIPLAGVLATTISFAQKVTFNPSIGAWRGYTDNVRYVGVPQSDGVSSVLVELPLLRETRTQNFGLLYQPMLLRHDDFEELDRDEHRLRIDFDSTMPQGRFSFLARVDLTQQQGVASSDDDADFVLTQRTDRKRYLAELEYERAVSTKWEWTTQVRGVARRYDAIGGTSATEVEDRDELSGSVGVAHTLSRTSSLGLEYTYRQFELQVSGDQDVNSLSVVYDRQISRRMSLRASLGGYQRDGTQAGMPIDESGAEARLTLGRTYRSMRLGLVAAHYPSAGGARRGTSTNSVLGLNVTDRGSNRWNWRVSPRLARRERSTGTETTSAALGARVERRVTRQIGVSLNASYLNQSDDQSVDDDSTFEASLGLIWYPLGEAERR